MSAYLEPRGKIAENRGVTVWLSQSQEMTDAKSKSRGDRRIVKVKSWPTHSQSQKSRGGRVYEERNHRHMFQFGDIMWSDLGRKLYYIYTVNTKYGRNGRRRLNTVIDCLAPYRNGKSQGTVTVLWCRHTVWRWAGDQPYMVWVGLHHMTH